MKTLLVTVALGAAMISAPLAAQAPGGGERGAWQQRDQTRQEAQQRADMMFQMLDANKDGAVTKAEADQALAQFQAMRGDDKGGRGGGRMQRLVEQLFAASPSVTQAQVEALALARFDAQDLNHDGTVTVAERQQLREQRQAMKPQAAPVAQPQAAPAPQPPASKPQ
ncbi:MAG: hypothetical protein ACJ8FT_05810 [Sphingomonas sp.]